MKIMEVNTVYKLRSSVLSLLLGLCALNCLGQAASPVAPKPNLAGILAGIIEEVLARGPSSQIPAHLSLVLGISAIAHPTVVKQAVMRDGELMRTFNVRSDQRGDVVLMAYDTRTRATKAYLTDPAGTLRKAVSYQPGEAPTERTSTEARNEFTAEKRFWLNLPQAATPAPH